MRLVLPSRGHPAGRPSEPWRPLPGEPAPRSAPQRKAPGFEASWPARAARRAPSTAALKAAPGELFGPPRPPVVFAGLSAADGGAARRFGRAPLASSARRTRARHEGRAAFGIALRVLCRNACRPAWGPAHELHAIARSQLPGFQVRHRHRCGTADPPRLGPSGPRITGMSPV